VSNHQVVALLEIVSPGNKNNQNGLNAFVGKAREALAAGIHLMLVDLFPLSSRDPQGIHRAVWGEDAGDTYVIPTVKPLTCVAYVGGASPSCAVDSEQMMYSMQFSLVFWGVGGIGFHYKTWSGLKRSGIFRPRAARMRLASP
jgi:hypothetical protein